MASRSEWYAESTDDNIEAGEFGREMVVLSEPQSGKDREFTCRKRAKGSGGDLARPAATAVGNKDERSKQVLWFVATCTNDNLAMLSDTFPQTRLRDHKLSL